MKPTLGERLDCERCYTEDGRFHLRLRNIRRTDSERWDSEYALVLPLTYRSSLQATIDDLESMDDAMRTVADAAYSGQPTEVRLGPRCVTVGPFTVPYLMEHRPQHPIVPISRVRMVVEYMLRRDEVGSEPTEVVIRHRKAFVALIRSDEWGSSFVTQEAVRLGKSLRSRFPFRRQRNRA